jgi:hypothetical protein
LSSPVLQPQRFQSGRSILRLRLTFDRKVGTSNSIRFDRAEAEGASMPTRGRSSRARLA